MWSKSERERQMPYGITYMLNLKYDANESESLSCSVASHYFAAPWTTACQTPQSVEFPRQEYWSGLPFLSPGDLPDPGIEPASPASPALAGGFLTTEPSIQNRNKLTDIENRLVIAKGWGGGERTDWKSGNSRCKLFYREWINIRVLLYSTGNYIQYPVPVMEKNMKKNVCV